jgi:Leucine-rich repeat
VDRWRWLGAAIAVLAQAGCGREPTVAEGAPAIVPEERAALDAILVRAHVDPAALPVRSALLDFSWHGDSAYARRTMGPDAEDAVDRRTQDLRNAVAVEGGHIVAVRLAGTRIDDLRLFAPLTHLVVLDVRDAAIARIEGLDGLRALDHLDLSGNALPRLEGLDDVPALHSLFLADERIERIEGLEHLPELQVLALEGNRIERIENLSLPKLTALSLARNAIARMEGLEGLPELVDLDLSWCHLGSMESLGALRKLRYLDLWHNHILSLAGIEEATPTLLYIGLGENGVLFNDAPERERCDRYCAGRMITFF